MSYDLVIKGGRVISSGLCEVADLAVEGEKIAAIGMDLSGTTTLVASGLYVLPGAIDGHVHLFDPHSASVPTADSFASGTKAAAFGGVTTVLDFAESNDDETLERSLMLRQQDADGQAFIDYGFHMNIRHVSPAHLAEVPAMLDLGVPSFKLFMAWEGYRLSDVELLRTMEAVASCRGLSIVHAENEDVIQELKQRLMARGDTGPRWHTATSPPATESEAIHRALTLGEMSGSRVLIFHISSRPGLRELAMTKGRGQPTYGEVCIQYLVLTDELCQSESDLAHSLMIRPPIRSRDHQDALWAGLVDGTVDIVSTDHGPRKSTSDGKPHPSGTSSIETRLALLHTFGVRSGRLSVERWVELCCERPAEVFGLKQKGRLAPGYDADVVLFDPGRKLVLSPQTLHSAIDYSTYDGIEVTGIPVTTISRGQVLVDNGELCGSPAHGRFVHRSY